LDCGTQTSPPGPSQSWSWILAPSAVLLPVTSRQRPSDSTVPVDQLWYQCWPLGTVIGAQLARGVPGGARRPSAADARRALSGPG
jgi:hypothetical protein